MQSKGRDCQIGHPPKKYTQQPDATMCYSQETPFCFKDIDRLKWKECKN